MPDLTVDGECPWQCPLPQWLHQVFNMVKLTMAPLDPIVGWRPTTPRNHRWRRGVGSGGNPRHQNDEPKAMVLDKVERLQCQAQHLGTLGQCMHRNS